MLARRDFIIGFGGASLVAASNVFANPSADDAFGGEPFSKAIRAAETLGGGRLGVAVLDSETGKRFAWRGDERFPVCSTFKFVLAAAILAEVDKGRERLDNKVPIAASDILEYAPVTGKHLGEGLTVADLCEAAIMWSDNTAANILLSRVGGPAGLTQFAQGLGDTQFRLDRIEPALNEAMPGDPRDTTTPTAMSNDLDSLLLGNALSPASRTQLTDWLIACRTGDKRIRAGLPKDWRVGDKTGTGGHGSSNDVAILWPPARRPILVASYLTETSAPADTANAALAAVGQAITDAIVAKR